MYRPKMESRPYEFLFHLYPLWASLVTQLVKNLPAMQKTVQHRRYWFDP